LQGQATSETHAKRSSTGRSGNDPAPNKIITRIGLVIAAFISEVDRGDFSPGNKLKIAGAREEQEWLAGAWQPAQDPQKGRV
jgi:hypothetical protein